MNTGKKNSGALSVFKCSTPGCPFPSELPHRECRQHRAMRIEPHIFRRKFVAVGPMLGNISGAGPRGFSY